MTLDCVEALRATRGAAWHLYIVDNASSDDSVDRLRGIGGDVTLIENPVNEGWTGGNNRGIEAALADGHDHVFILNNDALVEPDTLATLLKARGETGTDAVLGPLQIGVDDPEADFFGAYRHERTGMPVQYRKNPAPSDSTYAKTYTVKGAAIFAHRRHFDRVGLLDERFYLNCDDTDWCLRAAAAGFPLLMVQPSSVRHIGSASLGDYMAPLQTYFRTRNRLLLAEKHGTRRERLRQWRSTVRQVIDLAGQSAPKNSRAAARLGALHYLVRRFGDCPDIVRKWHAEARAQIRPS